MAEPTTDAFLRGRGIPVDPTAIERELVRLWGPEAERVGGPDLDRPAVTRLVLANLVVREGPGPAAALDALVARHPCRAIVLRVDDHAPPDAISAEVSALCHLPAPGLPQVCSERIVLRAAPDAFALLPGAVRPLLEPDLPIVLWWGDDPRSNPATFRTLASECSRLILDLPDPGADPDAIRAGLDPNLARFARDAAWFGATPWRELIAQFFDPPSPLGDLLAIASVDIQGVVPPAAPSSTPPRLAIWLAAWLAGQLDWQARGTPRRSPGRIDADFDGPSGPIAASIRVHVDPKVDAARIVGVFIVSQSADGPSTFRLDRPDATSPEVRVGVSSPSICALPRVVRLDEPGPADRIDAALTSDRDDPPARRALPHGLWLLGG